MKVEFYITVGCFISNDSFSGRKNIGFWNHKLLQTEFFVRSFLKFKGVCHMLIFLRQVLIDIDSFNILCTCPLRPSLKTSIVGYSHIVRAIPKFCIELEAHDFVILAVVC